MSILNGIVGIAMLIWTLLSFEISYYAGKKDNKMLRFLGTLMIIIGVIVSYYCLQRINQ